MKPQCLHPQKKLHYFLGAHDFKTMRLSLNSGQSYSICTFSMKLRSQQRKYHNYTLQFWNHF